MQMKAKKWWMGAAALTLALGAPILSHAQNDDAAKKAEAAKKAAAAKKLAEAIPMTTGTDLTTFKPSAAEVLTPPESFTGDIKIAKTPPTFDFGVLPGQWEGAELWSNWGDSEFANGKFYASIGDHDGHYGNTMVYEVDPVNKKMEMVIVFNDVVGLTDKTQYAPGKIHCPLMDGGDGWLYFFGYRGRYRQTGAELDYVGDPMLRYNPVTRVTENWGPVIPDNSVSGSQIHIPSRTLYALGDHGMTAKVQAGQFYAYNLDTRQMIFAGGPEPNITRSIMLAPDGRVFYSVNKPGTGRAPDKNVKGDKGEPPVGILARYNPRTNKVTLTDDIIPGDGRLRAATLPNAQGIVYAFSNSGVIFSYDTNTEEVTEIATATFAGPAYTTSCKLDPTGRYLYYIPSAHGGSIRHGTAVFQLDTQTGERKILAFLNDYLRKQINYNLGGTFGIALNEDGSQLFICWNGRTVGGKNDDFGQSSVMIIHIPESERMA